MRHLPATQYSTDLLCMIPKTHCVVRVVCSKNSAWRAFVEFQALYVVIPFALNAVGIFYAVFAANTSEVRLPMPVHTSKCQSMEPNLVPACQKFCDRLSTSREAQN